MTVINNATLILKDKQGNEGVVKSFTDNDINKISNAITDIGQVVDPATHTPIEATKTSVGVVQLADDEAIAAGTTGRVVDAKQLKAVSDRMVNGVHLDGAITGKIEWFAFNTAPDGYLVCNGANVSRTTYADLFNAIGATFGSGDGSTTFTLPNLIDKFAQGSTTVGTVKRAGLPNIKGDLAFGDPNAWLGVSLAAGAFISDGGSTLKANQDGSGYSTKIQVRFDAKQYNPIYGNSETVQPPALTLLPCIRY